MSEMHYHRPTTLADAAKQSGAHPDDRVLAGGQSILPSMRLGLMSTDGFVDLSGVAELHGIKVEGNSVRIGAMTTHAAVAASKDVGGKIRALALLAGDIGDRAVRNRGTLGGSLANSEIGRAHV